MKVALSGQGDRAFSKVHAYKVALARRGNDELSKIHLSGNPLAGQEALLKDRPGARRDDGTDSLGLPPPTPL